MASDPDSLWNKVPEITLYFWVIKILCTTVGETAADYINISFNLGLTITSILVGVLLVIALVWQFKTKKYVPAAYWLTVFLISIFGTLVTDNLTDSLGVPLELSTIVFTVLLLITFAVWYAREKTLSIHAVNTRAREAFYWVAILFTFALGTAAGDLMAESLGLGYLLTGLIICALVVCFTIAWKLGLDSVLAFWIAYIMTRPLGASVGDYLSQAPANGGLGLGPTTTTIIFVLAIIITVVFLTITKKDQIRSTEPTKARASKSAVTWQVIGVLLVLTVLAISGYFLRQGQLERASILAASSTTPLGDLSEFRQITTDTLALVRSGDFAGAQHRIADLESAWDIAQPKLRSMSPDDWTTVDDAIDDALSSVRSHTPDKLASEHSLTTLINTMDSLGKSNEQNAPAEPSQPQTTTEPVPPIDNTPPPSVNNTTPVAQPPAQQQAPPTPTPATHGPLGDLSEFKTITQDTLDLVLAGDSAGAKDRITDLESAWDGAQRTLKSMSKKDWTTIDMAIDDALRKVRSGSPDASASEDSLNALLDTMNSLDK